jgi:TDG/mug DNA glycosylase family protein
MKMVETLPDVVAPGLSVIFVGTAVGSTSAERQAYYAGPGNKFWTMLCETGLTSRRLRPDEYQEILQYGLGLTDVVKGQSGPDRDVRRDVQSSKRLEDLMVAVAPDWLAFNGKTAAKWALERRRVEYGEQPERWGKTRIMVLPSTSGAANGFWDAKPWFTLAKLVRQS